MFGRSTDWRRLALRDDRCAHTVFFAICLAATGIFGLSFTRPDPSRTLFVMTEDSRTCDDLAYFLAQMKMQTVSRAPAEKPSLFSDRLAPLAG